MRVFISEFVCGGGWPEPEPGASLATEGRAMLSAIARDFARVPDVQVTTTWDARLRALPFENVHTIAVESPDDELPVFRELASLCDATLVVAPEFHDLLAGRCRIVEAAGGRLLGPDSRAVALCADKLVLAGRLEAAGVPTIPTAILASDRAAPRSGAAQFPFPIVVKPRDGAGSQSTYLIRDADEFAKLQPGLTADPLLEGALLQPFVPGAAVSVGLIVNSATGFSEVFPPAEQILSDDGRFRYLGGVVPARGVDRTAIQETARAACRAVPGLRGYVGVDLILPAETPRRPVVVEINPRLATSYIGYRRLTEENLAERMLALEATRPVVWHDRCVSFDAAGNASLLARPIPARTGG